MLGGTRGVVCKARLVRGALLATVLWGAACDSPSGPPVGPLDPCPAAKQIRASSGFMTVAAEADVAARVLPGGFGGLYMDIPQQRLTVFLKDVSKAAEVEPALRKLLLCDGAYPGWVGQLVNTDLMTFRSGQFTGSELLAHLQALQVLLVEPGVWAMEVDPEVNRIWVGVRGQGDVARVQQVVGATSVPLTALVLEVPPPTTGVESFQVLPIAVITEVHTVPGTFQWGFRTQYVNRHAEPRYVERCLELGNPESFFRYVLDRWDGVDWRRAYSPLCVAIALLPPTTNPGQAEVDSLGGAAVRRMNATPLWQTVRITGHYRMLGNVYLTVTPGPPFLGNPAPASERPSAPFRIIHTLPF